jgi:hypothetical protein
MKKLLIFILCLSSFSAYAGNTTIVNKESFIMQSPNDLNNPENMKRICSEAFSNKNIKKVEDLINQFKKPQTLTYQGKNYTYYTYDLNMNGDYKIEPCYIGVINNFNSPALSVDEKESMHQELLTYLKIYPKSDTALTFNAIFELTLAAQIRNNDLNDSLANLSKEQNQAYSLHLLNANNYLQASTELFHTPLWYKTRIELENWSSSKNQEIMDKYLSQSIKLYPDYIPSYIAYSTSLLPENGGSWMLINNIAQKAMFANQDRYMYQFYARFYAAIAKSYKFSGLVYNQSLFEVSAEQFLTQFNTDYNYNRMAKATCVLNSPRMFIAFSSKMTTINTEIWNNMNFYNQCMSEVKQPIKIINK